MAHRSTEDGAIDLQHGVTHFTHDFPPGTEIVDASGKEEHIHYPLPSDRLDDPLNWSSTWKVTAILVVLWYVWWATFPILSVTALYGPLIMEWGATVDQISALSSWGALCLAFSNFLALSLGHLIGRKPVLLISTAGCFAACLWFGLAGSYNSAFASRIVFHIAAAPVETFGPLIIADLFFTTQRARFHSYFFFSLIVSTNTSAAVSGGFADSSATWRGNYYFLAAMLGSCFPAIYFLYPETNWIRSNRALRGALDETTTGPASGASALGFKGDVSDVNSNDEKSGGTAATTAVAAHANLVGTGKPSPAQRWGLTSGINKDYQVWLYIWTWVRLQAFLPFFLAAGWFMAAKAILVGQGYVAAQIWQAPPYFFSNAGVGATNVPSIIAIGFGTIFWGFMSDWDLARRTRNNGGIREPEMRLWLILPGAIIGIVGVVIYAIGIQRQWPWQAILIVGTPLQNIGLAAPLVCATSYAIDIYKQYAGEVSLSMNVYGNVLQFGIGYFINDLLVKRGPLICLIMLTIPVFGMTFFTVVFLVFGKTFRRWTMNSSLVR